MAKLFGGYKSIFFHVNHIHINFPSALGELDMNYDDTFLFIISNKFSSLCSARSLLFWLLGQQEEEKEIKRAKFFYSYMIPFQCSLDLLQSARCVTLFTAMANIQNSLMDVPVTTFFSLLLHEELQKQFKDIKFLLCAFFGKNFHDIFVLAS